MKTILVSGLCIGLLVACGDQPDKSEDSNDGATGEQATAPQSASAELGEWGVDLTAMNKAVDPGDDFFRYVNGGWLDSYELKPDQIRYGSFLKLRDRSEEQVKAIIDELMTTEPADGSIEQKVRDYFASYMDMDARNAEGISAIQPELDEIAAIEAKEDLVGAFADTDLTGATSPIAGGVSLDRKQPDRYIISFGHSGLGLPDRDYYLEDNERFGEIRQAYVAHIAEMLQFAGVDAEAAAQKADAIMALETRIAEHHWPRAELRNRDKTYNMYTLEGLTEEFPGFDWQGYIVETGLDPATLGEVNVSTPSAINPLIEVIAETPLETFKAYLTYHILSNNADLLSDDIGQANFEFHGKILNGREEQRDLWKRAVRQVGSLQGLGEAIGQIYVERHFPPEAKAQMEDLVENLRRALRLRIENLDWMGEETKQEAYRKLEAFNPKIGYPDQWTDVSGIEIKAGELMANVREVRRFARQKTIERFSKPADKDRWFMTPQTVNAYYNPQWNEIVFPAAILQPPFFDPNADPAVNYAAIGGVIGHEMGHGFDDQGSKSDARGIQRNWWTDEDRKRFEERTARLVEQYNAFEPIEGEHINGQLTLGENIGDLGGLSMAYTAYKLSLDGKEAPVKDGLTGDQRFFMAWAQVWRSKAREQYRLRQLRTDPHAPAMARVNGVVRNVDPWYDAFDVSEDDDLYLPPEERVSIW